jgi:hypothetical protein
MGFFEASGVAKRVYRRERCGVAPSDDGVVLGRRLKAETILQRLREALASIAEIAVKLATRQSHVSCDGYVLFALDVASSQNSETAALLRGLGAQFVDERLNEIWQVEFVAADFCNQWVFRKRSAVA